VATKNIGGRDRLKLFKTGRKAKKLNGASVMCRHIRKQLSKGEPLDTGTKFFDAGEFALCSWCARWFVFIGPEASVKALRLARIQVPKSRRRGSLSAPAQ
jgi:hypothetical protein